MDEVIRKRLRSELDTIAISVDSYAEGVPAGTEERIFGIVIDYLARDAEISPDLFVECDYNDIGPTEHDAGSQVAAWLRSHLEDQGS